MYLAARQRLLRETETIQERPRNNGTIGADCWH